MSLKLHMALVPALVLESNTVLSFRRTENWKPAGLHVNAILRNCRIGSVDYSSAVFPISPASVQVDGVGNVLT